MHRMAVLALPQVVAFDLAIPLQVFGHVDRAHQYRVDIVAETPLIQTTTGYAITRTADLAAAAEADTLVVPGFHPFTPSDAALDVVRAAHERGARVMSICTGAFALAHAGVLNGLRATTHWHHTDELSTFAGVTVEPDVLYVDEGQVLTSAGVAAGLDLSLYVFRSDHGAEAAAEVARRMVLAPHRAGGQAQFIHRPQAVAGPSMAPLCEWVVNHLAEPHSIRSLALRTGFAERTFTRRFLAETGVTPMTWVTSQRVALARRMLESTDHPVDVVARRSGLGTAANMRLLLRRDAGVSPSTYRAAFRGSDQSVTRTPRVQPGS